MANINLLPNQIENYDTLYGILKSNKFCLNLSALGTGKTIVTMKIIQDTGHIPFFVMNKTLVSNWEAEADKFGFDINRGYIISLETLRGTVNKKAPIVQVSDVITRQSYELSHGWLIRHDFTKSTEKKEIKYTRYEPTQKLKDLINQDVMFVLDEADSVKNGSLSNECVAAITRAIRGSKSKSRYMFLSGSIFDKEELAENMWYALGLTTCSELIKVNNFAPPGFRVTLTGLKQIIAYSELKDKTSTQEVLNEVIDGEYQYLTAKLARTIAFRLFQNIIVKHMSHAMDAPIRDIELMDLYMKIPESDILDNIRGAVNMLADAAKYNSSKDKIEGEMDIGAIINALICLERAKIPLIIQQVKSILKKSTNKVIVAIEYKDTFASLQKELSMYDPICINGDTKFADRAIICRQFREESEPRLLLLSKKVGSHGISLHSVNEGQDHHMIIIPDYSITRMYQLTGRIAREGQKGKAIAQLLYGTDKNLNIKESSIIGAIARKKDVLKSVAINNNNKLPGEFDPIYVQYIL